MNASSWKKAVDLVAKATPANPQVQVAATGASQQLESLPLSALSIDDSGPPQVTYDSQQSIATSTPRATLTVTSETPTEAYRQILPGMSNHLYPTLIADGSLNMHVPDNHGTLQTHLTSEVDKYCYIVGLGLNCKFIDLLFKCSVIKFIKSSSHLDLIVSEIIYNQTDTLTQRLMDLR